MMRWVVCMVVVSWLAGVGGAEILPAPDATEATGTTELVWQDRAAMSVAAADTVVGMVVREGGVWAGYLTALPPPWYNPPVLYRWDRRCVNDTRKATKRELAGLMRELNEVPTEEEAE